MGLISGQVNYILQNFLFQNSNQAVWDDDFEAIQWGEHEGGETILINYKLLGSVSI